MLRERHPSLGALEAVLPVLESADADDFGNVPAKASAFGSLDLDRLDGNDQMDRVGNELRYGHLPGLADQRLDAPQRLNGRRGVAVQRADAAGMPGAPGLQQRINFRSPHLPHNDA